MNFAEESILPSEISYYDVVRLNTWTSGFVAIATEDKGDGWVKILWSCDRGHEPPDVFTMVRADETVYRQWVIT